MRHNDKDNNIKSMVIEVREHTCYVNIICTLYYAFMPKTLTEVTEHIFNKSRHEL